MSELKYSLSFFLRASGIFLYSVSALPSQISQHFYLQVHAQDCCRSGAWEMGGLSVDGMFAWHFCKHPEELCARRRYWTCVMSSAITLPFFSLRSPATFILGLPDYATKATWAKGVRWAGWGLETDWGLCRCMVDGGLSRDPPSLPFFHLWAGLRHRRCMGGGIGAHQKWEVSDNNNNNTKIWFFFLI